MALGVVSRGEILGGIHSPLKSGSGSAQFSPDDEAQRSVQYCVYRVFKLAGADIESESIFIHGADILTNSDTSFEEPATEISTVNSFV